MISDNYSKSTAVMLRELGYVAAFMEDLKDGTRAAIMEHDYSDEETRDVVTFFTSLRVNKSPQFTYDELGYAQQTGTSVQFIALHEDGTTTPESYGGSWGIYVKSEDL